MPDLMLLSNQKRQEFVQDISRTIREVHENFKSYVPVYLIFTKCDQVEGFMEFFNDMSKEELLQVWGISLPLNECNNLHAVQSLFNREYTHLVNQLRKRVLWAFDTERNSRGRELIHSFPQQMQLLKQPIETFILELFSATRYQKALQLRGLYFTSSKQEGQSYDFLLAALSKKFQLVPPTLHRPQRMGECYFARHLFAEVIYPESNALGESERSKRRSTFFYRSALMLMPALVLGLSMAMYSGYQENLSTLNLVDSHLANYQQAYANLNQSDVSLESILPLLNEINAARELYRHSPWAMDTLFATHTIASSLNDALMRNLHSLYLPRVASQIEAALNQNINDQNLLYATLKGYLAFSASDYSKAAAITLGIRLI
jgi:type VI secretion system protein ImpL